MGDAPVPLDAVAIADVGDIPDGTSFEDAMAELERCVDLLEAGGVGLEDAVVLFRRGAALERWCQATLDGISATIEELTADGAPAAADGD